MILKGSVGSDTWTILELPSSKWRRRDDQKYRFGSSQKHATKHAMFGRYASFVVWAACSTAVACSARVAPIAQPAASHPIDVPSYAEGDLAPLIEAITDQEVRALRRRHHPCERSEVLGKPARGSLRCARFVPTHPRLRPRTRLSFGAAVTMLLLQRAAICMDKADPGGPPIDVLHISQKTGGRTKVHLSHQNGLDVDLGFFMQATDHEPKLYEDPPITAIDALRTWKLTRCLIDSGLVQIILMDWEVQMVVEAAATADGLSFTASQKIFQWPRLSLKRGFVRDEAGHRSHLHVRVRCPSTETECADAK